MSDPGDESHPRKPEEVSTTLKFLEPPGRMKDVAQWWLDTAGEDFTAAVPKADEYGGTDTGSADLQIMGFALMKLRVPEDAPPELGQEIACWFYTLGKVARLISNYNAGETGKPDSWHDISVYSMMARRLQQIGRWP